MWLPRKRDDSDLSKVQKCFCLPACFTFRSLFRDLAQLQILLAIVRFQHRAHPEGRSTGISHSLSTRHLHLLIISIFVTIVADWYNMA